MIDLTPTIEYAKRQRPPRTQRHFLYVIADESPMVKVGRTTGIKNRLASYVSHTGNPKLRVWYAKECGEHVKDVEQRVHETLAPHRAHGEWYNVTAAYAVGVCEKVRSAIVTGEPEPVESNLPSTAERLFDAYQEIERLRKECAHYRDISAREIQACIKDCEAFLAEIESLRTVAAAARSFRDSEPGADAGSKYVALCEALARLQAARRTSRTHPVLQSPRIKG